MKSKYIIAIDGRYLIGQKRGINQYIKNVINQISHFDDRFCFKIFVNKNYYNEEIFFHKNIEIIRTFNVVYPLWENLIFPLYAYKKGANLIHFTANTGGWLLPKFLSLKILVTIHDVYFMKNKNIYPQSINFKQFIGSLYRRVVVKKLAKLSDKIITVSEFAKSEIHEYLGIDLSKIVVINNVLDTRYLDNIKDQNFSKKNNIIVLVGGDHPQKNIIPTVKLLDKYCHDILLDWRIKICGLSKIKNLINSNKLNIDLYGHLDEKELFELYKLARVLLFPSLNESFGIPILEALATDNQVVAMNAGAVKEVLRNYGNIYDYNNGEDLRKKIINAIKVNKLPNNDSLRKYLFSFSNSLKKNQLKETYLELLSK